jgi:hypothetical protein
MSLINPPTHGTAAREYASIVIVGKPYGCIVIAYGALLMT